MRQITQNVFVETNFIGCNTTFISTSEGVVMIDTPQLPIDSIKWKEIISKYGTVKYLINSEPHVDHISGNCFFDGTGVSYQGSRDVILSTPVDMIKSVFAKVSPESSKYLENYFLKPPTITFNNTMSLYSGKHTFNLYHLPGHSPYQISIHIPEEQVIVTSDNVIYKLLPGFRQVMPYEWLKSLDFLMTLGKNVLVPGHGEVCDSDYLPEIKSVVQDCINLVLHAIRDGMTLEEAQNRLVLAPGYPLESKHPMTYEYVQRESIAALYKALSAQT